MSAHKYELMFIADPELDERGLKKLTGQLSGSSSPRKAALSMSPITGAVASSPMRLPVRPKATTSW